MQLVANRWRWHANLCVPTGHTHTHAPACHPRPWIMWAACDCAEYEIFYVLYYIFNIAKSAFGKYFPVLRATSSKHACTHTHTRMPTMRNTPLNNRSLPPLILSWHELWGCGSYLALGYTGSSFSLSPFSICPFKNYHISFIEYPLEHTHTHSQASQKLQRIVFVCR